MKAGKGPVVSARGNRMLIFTVVLLSPDLAQSCDARRHPSDAPC